MEVSRTCSDNQRHLEGSRNVIRTLRAAISTRRGTAAGDPGENDEGGPIREVGPKGPKAIAMVGDAEIHLDDEAVIPSAETVDAVSHEEHAGAGMRSPTYENRWCISRRIDA